MICKFTMKDCCFKKYDINAGFICKLSLGVSGQCPYEPNIRTVYQEKTSRFRDNKQTRL